MTLLTAMYAPSKGNGRLDTLRDGLRARFEAWKTYRTTLNELNSLSDRELNDLGLHRTSLTAVARDAAYGE